MNASATPATNPPAAAPQLLVERHGAVLLLKLSNPAARNALHPDIYRGAAEAFARARDETSVRTVVLAGDGENFCAGGNLNRLLANRARDPAEQYASLEALHDWVRAMRSLEKPVIAAVEGAAAGAGFSLAMACDMIVAAEDARFVMAYVKVGLSPDGGATQWLGTRLPYPLAYELLATGAPVDAPRLHALGVVNRLAPRGQAVAAAMQLAAQLADGPPRVLARIKRMLDAAAPERLARQLDHERDAFLESLYEADAGEGIQAFLDKRPPRFGGSGGA